jgi:hypothetical protein
MHPEDSRALVERELAVEAPVCGVVPLLVFEADYDSAQPSTRPPSGWG